MKLVSASFSDGDKIPGDFAFCIPDDANHLRLSKNMNPQLTWSEVPSGTRSFALICHDPDVPSRGDDVNQEGRSVPASLPRVDFFHWVLFDLHPNITEIQAGEFSREVTPKGKGGPQTLHGARHGINSYTDWFSGDNDMRGDYYGYDGPCPPWNDEIPHHYVFTLYALDVDVLPLQGKVTGQQVRDAIKNHILGEAQLTGIYTLNPAVRI